MKIIYRLPQGSWAEAENPNYNGGFSLGNGAGNYLWLENSPQSRYQGWFLFLDGRFGQNMVKAVENIEIKNAPPVLGIINSLWEVKRIRGELTESFFMPDGKNAMVYQASKKSRIDIILDIKESYKNNENGRAYCVKISKGVIVVKFHQKDNFLFPEFYIAIKTDASVIDAANEWIERCYQFDDKRGSQPFKRWVFKPAAVEATLIVFAAAAREEEAVKEAESVFKNLSRLKFEKRQRINSAAKLFLANTGIGSGQGLQSESCLAASGLCSMDALKRLYVSKKSIGTSGLLAGLPWFFQFWQRDEALSAAGLSQFNMASSLDILSRQMSEIEKTISLNFNEDGIGWLFLNTRRCLYEQRFISESEKIEIFCLLEKTIKILLDKKTKNGFAWNECGQTWMDSIPRPGARIELQALRINLYGFAARIADTAQKREYYRKLETDLLLKTRLMFVKNGTLIDGILDAQNNIDATARPNIFLAAYACPEMFSRLEWSGFFEKALGCLWLDWGGLSSVDKKSPQFRARHSGENPESYHNGDSWFYVNNIAAAAMHKTDPLKFHPYVKKIFDAGIRNVLWGQAAASASELSSAEFFEPAGCFNQAWSSATFLELIGIIGKTGI